MSDMTIGKVALQRTIDPVSSTPEVSVTRLTGLAVSSSSWPAQRDFCVDTLVVSVMRSIRLRLGIQGYHATAGVI